MGEKVHFSIIYCDADCFNSTTAPRFRSDGWLDFRVESRHGTLKFVVCPDHFDETPSLEDLVSLIAGASNNKESDNETDE